MIDNFAKLFPKKLRVGQWTFTAKMYLFLVLSGTAALKFYVPNEEQTNALAAPLDPRLSQIVRAIGSIWGIGVLTWMCKSVGPWPFLSFTMQSWTYVSFVAVVKQEEFCTHKILHNTQINDCEIRSGFSWGCKSRFII